MDYEKYIDVYLEILTRVTHKEVAIAILAEVAKDARMVQIGAQKEQRSRPASAKQIEYLESLGVEVKRGLSSTEASSLIDRAKGR